MFVDARIHEVKGQEPKFTYIVKNAKGFVKYESKEKFSSYEIAKAVGLLSLRLAA